MDAIEKIVRFDSYESLLDEIVQDTSNTNPLRSRYPVRFIMLNNFEVFTKLAIDLAHLGVSSLNLESLLKPDEPDGWITIDDLKKAIKSCANSTLVTPFSELVRFYKEIEFRGFFNEIMLIEDIDHPHKRIYIPLIGLHNRFTSFLNGFARIEESAPVWSFSSEDQKTEVYLSEYKTDLSYSAGKGNICSLNNMFEWLSFWKNQAPQTQIVCSSGPIRRRSKYSDPDNIFTFKYIDSANEYIESFLGVTVPITYDSADNHFWEFLLKDIIHIGPTIYNFNTYILNRFNVRSLSPSIILVKWSDSLTSDYNRWLLKGYFMASNIKEDYPYFRKCIEECDDYKFPFGLIKKIAERIFYFAESTTQLKLAKERRNIIRENSQEFIESTSDITITYIRGRLSEIDSIDTSLAIALCTGVFAFEKILLSNWYANRKGNGFSYNQLRELYPELAMYFSNSCPSVSSGVNWHIDYLQTYRENKLSDTYSNLIQKTINTKNHNSDSFYNWYHSFEETHNRLVEYSNSPNNFIDEIYWIDALGAEFLPFILSLFENGLNGFHIKYSEITRCTIPSATSLNKFENIAKFGELDDIAHEKNGYKRYCTLINELSAIQSIFQNITIKHYGKEVIIAIVSDHGLSALSRLCESKKYDAKVEHDGRYIKVLGDENAHHDSDYVVHINENNGEKYKVALSHSSLGRKPIHEVHGGCCPEEVLVPFIVLSNKKNNLVQYDYEVLTKEVDVSNLMISVNVMPTPQLVVMIIKGKEYPMTRNGSVWSVYANDLSEGEHIVTFSISGGTPYSTSIKVNGTGFSENDFLNF